MAKSYPSSHKLTYFLPRSPTLTQSFRRSMMAGSLFKVMPGPRPTNLFIAFPGYQLSHLVSHIFSGINEVVANSCLALEPQTYLFCSKVANSITSSLRYSTRAVKFWLSLAWASSHKLTYCFPRLQTLSLYLTITPRWLEILAYSYLDLEPQTYILPS